MKMTDLQTELAALIGNAIEEWHQANPLSSGAPGIDVLAARLAAAFQQVGWVWRRLGGGGPFLHTDAVRRGIHGDKPCAEVCEPVYRFVRPESVEPKEEIVRGEN